MIRVSIIIPNYNHADFLHRRLNSIFDQTFQNYEVIILDDYSTDGSRLILQQFSEKYRDKVSHLIFNKENSGSPFKQWKKGLELSKGEYIWIAESDDWADKRFLEYCIQEFEKNSAIGVVFTNSNWMNKDGKRYLRYMFEGALSNEFVEKKSGTEIINNWLLKEGEIIIGNTSSAVFKRQAYLNHIQNDPYFEKFYTAGDKYFWGKILIKNDAVCIYEALNYYRTHTESTTSNRYKSKKRLFQDIRENIFILNYLEQHQIFPIPLIIREKKRYLNRWWNRANTLKDKIATSLLVLQSNFKIPFYWLKF